MKLDKSMVGKPVYDRIENDAYYTRDLSLLDGLYYFEGEIYKKLYGNLFLATNIFQII